MWWSTADTLLDMITRLPAEWENQSAVMLTWPHQATDWSARLEQVLQVFGAIGATISRFQLLLSVCHSAQHRRRVHQTLVDAGANRERLMFRVCPSDDSWARDHGPLATLESGTPVLHDFVFDGWGGKFSAEQDDGITRRLAADATFGRTEVRRHALVLEGGALETDGRGTLLATRSSVLNETRNPGLDRRDIERWLSRALGFRRYLWLDHGRVSGDDTDGHIDTLARFCDPATIAFATAPPGDRDHAPLTRMHRQLAGFRRADGSPYRLVPLPFAGDHRDRDGRRLPASYANFLLVNGAVLVPVYGVDEDALATGILAELFPGRKVVPVDCREIIRQNGSLHCVTMQFPAALTLEREPGGSE